MMPAYTTVNIAPQRTAMDSLGVTNALTSQMSGMRAVTAKVDAVASPGKLKNNFPKSPYYAAAKQALSGDVHSIGRRRAPLVSSMLRRVQVTAVHSETSDVSTAGAAETERGAAEETELGAGLVPVAENGNEGYQLSRLQTSQQPQGKKGDKMAEFLTLLFNLLDRPFGSGQGIAAAGGVVLERVQADAEALCDVEDVNQQYVFEFLRVTRLLGLDMELVASARKVETLMERLDQAKVHCRQAIDIAKAL